jgi:hypothetical protein
LLGVRFVLGDVLIMGGISLACVAVELVLSLPASHDFPKFVLGFLLISSLTPAGFFSKPQIADLANLSRWAFLLTFAGVGLRTNIPK